MSDNLIQNSNELVLQGHNDLVHDQTNWEAAAEQAKIDLEKSVQRRMSAAEEKIASAQASAEREVRDAAISVAVAAATEILSSQMSSEISDKLTENAISEVQTKFH